jgi:hypothetical protein
MNAEIGVLSMSVQVERAGPEWVADASGHAAGFGRLSIMYS